MPQFLVKVADEQGHLRQQVENGYSEAEVHDRFTQQGYLVYWVKPRTILSRGGGQRGKLRQSAFLIFNQQFLTLIKAGLPILTALDLLIKRQRDKSLLRLLEDVRERVKGGELLSDAFAAQQVFPKMYTTTLMAGEKSGSMEEVLGRYIAYQRMVQTFRKKLLVSLVYPALLVSVVTVMLIFLITYVVPKFADLFNNLGAQLPAITVFMLTVGLNAQKYGWVVLLAAAVAVVLLLRWKQSDRGAEQIDRFLLSDAAARGNPAEVSGGEFFAHSGDAAARRPAPGAGDGDGWRIDEQPANVERGHRRGGAGERRTEPGAQPGGAKVVSRSGGGNAGGRRSRRARCRRCSARWRSSTKKTCRRLWAQPWR